MATKVQRTKPLTITEQQRRWMVQYGTGEQALGAQEIVTTSDQLRMFRRDTYLGPVDHGSVDSVDALSTLYLLPSCTRGVWPDDTCWVTATGCEYRCISGNNSTAVWRPVGAGQDAANTAVWGGISGEIDDQSDLAVALAALVEAINGKANSTHSHTQADVSGLEAALAGKWATPSNAGVLADLADADGVLTYKGAGVGGAGAGVIVAEDGPPVDAYTYASAGDANGFIYAIATLFGGRPWQAPGVAAFAGAGKVGCLRSSEYTGSALLSVDRSYGVNVHTQSAAGAWQAWDLGAGNEFRPTGYTVRNRGLYGGIAIRNWKLQGTNNIASWTVSAVGAAEWTDIDTRTGDTTMANDADAWAYYACAQPATGYRYLRIVLTGTDANGSYYLAIGEFEIYGAAGVVPQLPEWANVWLTDGAGHYWPAYAAE